MVGDGETGAPAVVREALLLRDAWLSPRAITGANSRGRRHPELQAPFKSSFQVDRDRILRTKAFRRLKHKTQVFIAPLQDHYVTRLTHTLEVAQVARTIARALRLNEDLAEAAALGHDIGHGPFGHAGEDALAECLPDGFRHNYQSVRVLDVLENDGRGLNLMFETLDAIEKSSKVRADIMAEGWGVPVSFEGQIVKIADAIAYINHDLDDALRAGLLTEAQLPARVRSVLGTGSDDRLAALIGDAIASNLDGLGTAGAITLSPDLAEAANELREFLFQRVYHDPATLDAAGRGKRIVHFLFAHYTAHPEEIPSGYALDRDPTPRRAADYISGMTDRFASRLALALGHAEAAHFIS